VAQADALTRAGIGSVVCLVSSHWLDASTFRLTVEPTQENGLAQTSQVMVDKLLTVPGTRIGGVVGGNEGRARSALPRGCGRQRW